jgi:hypothetical protein
MYDVKRISSRLLVLLALAAAIALIGVAARPVLGGRASYFPEAESTVETPAFRKAAERVVAAQRVLSRADAQGTGRLGVLIGPSTLIDDIDPERIDAMPGWRWLSVYANGANVVVDCELGDLVIRGGLRPAIYLVVANASHLATITTLRDDLLTFDTDDIWFHLKHREWFKVQADAANLILVPWNNILPNRTRISGIVQQRLFNSQQDLLGAMGFPLDSLYPPDKSPWSVKHPYPNATHMPKGWDEFVERQLRKYHVFDPSSYSPEGPAVRSLVNFTRRARALGSDVLVVMTPERATLRSRVPREAESTLRDGLNRAFGAKNVQILDLRDAVDDSAFLDNVHLSDKGRIAFTKILSERLRPILSNPR